MSFLLVLSNIQPVQFLNGTEKMLAYLDPGSGSYLIQLLIAGLVGAAFIFKSYWLKLFRIFREHPKEDSNLTDPNDKSDNKD